METKEKSKRGKAIMGIAMAAIMLASVFVAMVWTTGAYSIEGGQYNIIRNDSAVTPIPVQQVLIGQDLDFNVSGVGWPGDIVTIYRVKDKAVVWTKMAGGDNTLTISGDDWKKEGAFYVNYVNETEYDAQLSFSDPDVPLKLKVDTKEVSSLTLGTNLTIDTSGINLFENDTVKLVIMKGGSQIKSMDDQVFDPITVKNLTAWYGRGTYGIDTTNFTVGTYTFQIKTDPSKACGLTAESAVKDLKVIKGEIAIEAETTSVTELEDVRLTVTGVAGDNITVEHTYRSPDVKFKGGFDDTPSTATSWFDHDIDSDGTRTYTVRFDESGSYTIRVTVTSIDSPRLNDYDTVDITVSEKGVTFDLPMTVVVGQKLTIRGTASSGDDVDIYVDKVLYKELDDLVLENGEFSKEVTVGDEIGMGVPGTVRLKAWIDGEYDVPDTRVPTESADGESAFLLTEPGLTAEISVAIVAQADSFYVTGTAKGARSVDILTVAPKGTSGTGMESSTDYPGITKKHPSVSEIDDTFSQKIPVDDDADTGTYLVAVFSAGRDRYYGTNASAKDLLSEIDVNYGNIGGKTQEQFVAMLIDLATQAGSDDLMWMGSIKVEAAKVELDPIADVALGAPLNVSGTTNREEGHIMLITVKGPIEITPQTASVESDGTFSATFDTTDAEVGTYTVKAEDGDGHTDDATVEILAEIVPIATPTPAPAVKPTAEPVPTAEPAPEPTPTPTPTPGFEAVFAIAGLLSIAYLVLRRRK